MEEREREERFVREVALAAAREKKKKKEEGEVEVDEVEVEIEEEKGPRRKRSFFTLFFLFRLSISDSSLFAHLLARALSLARAPPRRPRPLAPRTRLEGKQARAL